MTATVRTHGLPMSVDVQPPSLVVSQVTKRFGGVTAVDNVSFTLAPGEALAVIGPNGAGKSTLLKLLCGAYRTDQGSIRFGDMLVGEMTPHATARRGIGLAHQIPRPFKGLSVRENVAIGAMAHSSGRRTATRHAYVEDVLATCGLSDLA